MLMNTLMAYSLTPHHLLKVILQAQRSPPPTHIQTCSGGIGNSDYNKCGYSQPLYLYGQYFGLLVFSRNRRSVKGEGNISVITDQADSDLELSATERLSVFLPRSILLFLPVGQQTGQKVRELICAKTLRILLPTPLPFFLSFSLSDMQILDLLMRICYSQIPSVLLALCMRK